MLNSLPLEMSDFLEQMEGMQFASLRFTTETPEEQEEILGRYFRGDAPRGEFTRGLYRKGFA